MTTDTTLIPFPIINSDLFDIEFEFDGKNGKTLVFNEENALAHLLLEGIVSINVTWWRKDLSESDQKAICVFVNCNDVFMWACSDAENLPYSEIENLYKMYLKDPDWGPAVWCMQKRNMMPQKPLYDRIKKQGIWNLKKMKLGKNPHW